MIFSRTLTSIDPEAKHWLDNEAKRRDLAMTDLVRHAAYSYRGRAKSLVKPDLQAALAGIGSQSDGLKYRQRLRRTRHLKLPDALQAAAVIFNDPHT